MLSVRRLSDGVSSKSLQYASGRLPVNSMNVKIEQPIAKSLTHFLKDC